MSAVDIGALLKKKGLTLGIVESATGGHISDLITNIPGCSNYYKGSIIAYSNEVKMKLVGVTAGTIERHGVVSQQVAEEMASGGRMALDVDICISDTGIAGPRGASANKAVGLFYLGLADNEGAISRCCGFSGKRRENKEDATSAALAWLKEHLEAFE